MQCTMIKELPCQYLLSTQVLLVYSHRKQIIKLLWNRNKHNKYMNIIKTQNCVPRNYSFKSTQRETGFMKQELKEA